MLKHVVTTAFSEPVNVRLICLRCKQDLECINRREEPWFLDPNVYVCNCPNKEYWYVQLRYAPNEGR